MEIKVEDYLSVSEMRHIAQEEFGKVLRASCSRDLDRVIGNVSHTIVVELVNEMFGQDLEDLLKGKIIEQINNLTSYTVFKTPDAWDRTPSSAYHILEDTVSQNKHLLKERFECLVSELQLGSNFQVDFDYEVRVLLMKRLFGEKWEDEV